MSININKRKELLKRSMAAHFTFIYSNPLADVKTEIEDLYLALFYANPLDTQEKLKLETFLGMSKLALEDRNKAKLSN